jgi:hypothetical protein
MITVDNLDAVHLSNAVLSYTGPIPANLNILSEGFPNLEHWTIMNIEDVPVAYGQTQFKRLFKVSLFRDPEQFMLRMEHRLLQFLTKLLNVCPAVKIVEFHNFGVEIVSLEHYFRFFQTLIKVQWRFVTDLPKV